jgi:hypothetical protein
MGIAGTVMQKQKEGGDKRFRSLLVSEMGSETLVLFIETLFNNAHIERSNYHG